MAAKSPAGKTLVPKLLRSSACSRTSDVSHDASFARGAANIKMHIFVSTRVTSDPLGLTVPGLFGGYLKAGRSFLTLENRSLSI